MKFSFSMIKVTIVIDFLFKNLSLLRSAAQKKLVRFKFNVSDFHFVYLQNVRHLS